MKGIIIEIVEFLYKINCLVEDIQEKLEKLNMVVYVV